MVYMMLLMLCSILALLLMSEVGFLLTHFDVLGSCFNVKKCNVK